MTNFSKHIAVSVTCTKSVNIYKQPWAEGGPPASQLPPVCPTPCCARCTSCLPEQPIAPPAQPIQDPVQSEHVQVQPGQPQLNCSYFKPEFSGKPEEDAEAHF